MPISETSRAVNLQTPRVVKCPTPQCPGWITLDSTMHQTEPCRYCRVGVDTLRFLLSRVGGENKALPPTVHDEFNRLMLTLAGAWGRNVYLHPTSDTLVDITAGTRGVSVEYNPSLGAAGRDGVAPLVGTILHKLLHFEAHMGHRPVQIQARSGAKEKANLSSLLQYLLTVTDHVWVSSRLRELYPFLAEAQSRWGLDAAQMLVGSESMFNRYLSERNLNKLLAVLQEAEDDSEMFRDAVLKRLAALTAQILDHEREETRRIFLGLQLANLRLLNPDSYAAYTDALLGTALADVRESGALAERLYTELGNTGSGGAPSLSSKSGEKEAFTIDAGQYHKSLESGLKALGMANYFEVKS